LLCSPTAFSGNWLNTNSWTEAGWAEKATCLKLGIQTNRQTKINKEKENALAFPKGKD
jgi:hypothetical protein